MMTVVSDVETAPTMNPSALSGVRFLVTKRIEELDNSATALDEELAAVATRLLGASKRAERGRGELGGAAQRAPGR